MTSPRKVALLRKMTPKKKKLLKSPVVSVRSILSPNVDAVKQRKDNEEGKPSPPPLLPIPQNEVKELNLSEKSENLENSKDEEKSIEGKSETVQEENSDLNRSDTVQEVATLLTNLPETILAKTNSATSLDENNKIDPKVLLETPLKLDGDMSPLPNTPRFAIPLVAKSTHETPVPKAISSTTTVTSAIQSLVKVCDILTPSFPITPGFKETPAKSENSPTSGGGYSSRKTDYSSCSSYYKPDESEEINQNFESMIKQARERNSQSESDGATATEPEVNQARVGSAKKVECPGAIDRVTSFSEETKEVPIPHYTMMEEGVLSESMLTTASDSDDSSSSFTCSTCSTDPSSEENTTDILNHTDLPEDPVDGEWKCKDAVVNESNNSLVDEKTGEVRFPLRNLMTPRKMEQEINEIIQADIKEKSKERPKESPKKVLSDLEAIKQRTIRILKDESAGGSKNNVS